MKKQEHNPTKMIKAKFSNQVHKILEPGLDLPYSKRGKLKQVELTDAQKIEAFDKIKSLHSECSSELRTYQFNKRQKKRVNKARIERGYVTTKKTSKEEYLKMKSEKVVAPPKPSVLETTISNIS